MNRSSIARRTLSPALALAGSLALAAAARAEGPVSLVANSPFSPNGAASSAPGAKAPPGDYELSGSSSYDGEVTVCIFERTAKKSQWIPVGGDADGIHVVSYDPGRDTAVVTVSGARKELEMKRSVVGSLPVSGTTKGNLAGGPEEGPAMGGPGSPAAAAREQRDARMMVSDLLEIGVQQRRAYQAAKMKALPASAVPKQPGS